jgi:DNA polymerase-3 subunit alpha
MAVLEEALDYGQRIQREKNSAQMSLFGVGDGEGAVINEPHIPNIDEWDEREKLQQEKDALGFFVTGHPLNRYHQTLEKFTSVNALSLRDVVDKRAVRIGGIISAAKVIRTRKQEQMGFVTLEDLSGSVEVVVFPSLYAGCADLLAVDTAVLVRGTAQVEENGVKVLADEIIAMEKAEETWAVEVRLMVDAERTGREALARVRKTLKRYPGSCKGFVHIRLNNHAEAVVSMAAGMHIRFCEDMTREVNAIFGYDAVQTRCIDAINTMRDGDLNRGGGNGGRFFKSH